MKKIGFFIFHFSDFQEILQFPKLRKASFYGWFCEKRNVRPFGLWAAERGVEVTNLPVDALAETPMCNV